MFRSENVYGILASEVSEGVTGGGLSPTPEPGPRGRPPTRVPGSPLTTGPQRCPREEPEQVRTGFTVP